MPSDAIGALRASDRFDWTIGRKIGGIPFRGSDGAIVIQRMETDRSLFIAVDNARRGPRLRICLNDPRFRSPVFKVNRKNVYQHCARPQEAATNTKLSLSLSLSLLLNEPAHFGVTMQARPLGSAFRHKCVI